MTLSRRLTRPDEPEWPQLGYQKPGDIAPQGLTAKYEEPRRVFKSARYQEQAVRFGQEASGPEERVRLEGGPNVAFTFSLGEISGLFLVKSIPTMPKSQAGI